MASPDYKVILEINPIGAGGRTIFKRPFLHEKRKKGSGDPKFRDFWTFPNSLGTFRKSKKNFLVLHSVSG